VLRPHVTPKEELPIDDSFLDDQLLVVSHQDTPWYADFVNLKVCEVLPHGLSYPQKKFLTDAKYRVWEELLLYKLCEDSL